MIPGVVYVVVVAYLTMQLEDPVSALAHVYSEPAVRVAHSLQRRQSDFNAITVANLDCTPQRIVNIFEGYPSDCTNALQANLNSSAAQTVTVYSTLCLPRCNRALAQFYSECGTEDFIEVFFHLCAINSNNNRCYNIFETLLNDSRRVDAACPSDRSSCPSTCRDSILTFRDNSECCVNLYNNSATFPPVPSFSFTADEYSLWAACSVETPGFCTDSSVSRPGSPGTAVNPNAITFANFDCTQQQIDNIFDNYPSDCANALQLSLTSSPQAAFRTLCLPRCNRALARFYSECGTEGFVELFFQVCAINSDNNQCYDILATLLNDSRRVDAACPSDRSSCPSTCRGSILNFRENSGCCVNLYNNSARIPNFSFTADDYSLWAACSVETPGFCTDSSVSRPGTTVNPNAITFANFDCTQQQIDNIFDDYPSDCANALQLNLNLSPQAAFRTLCLPRCNRALTRFYSECGTEGFVELFFQVCAVNSDNNRCIDVLRTLFNDSRRVDAACPSDRSSCPSTCRGSILIFRENSGCCVNLYNNSARVVNFADDYSLWAACSVETPGFCTDSSVSRPGITSNPSPTSTTSCSGTPSTQNPLNKLSAGLVLLGVLTLLTP